MAVLKAWMRERGGDPADPLFPTRSGTPLSRHAVENLVAKRTATAARECLSLRTKHPTPHVLRHSCAMELLRSQVDVSVIALWLGHQRPDPAGRIYLHADLSIRGALACTALLHTKPGATAIGPATCLP